jgi:hypothetical protein
MSMVRFLVYANHYDTEGLVATTSVHQRGLLPWSLCRGGLLAGDQRMAGSEHPAQGSAWRRVSPVGIPDGGRSSLSPVHAAANRSPSRTSTNPKPGLPCPQVASCRPGPAPCTSSSR